MPHRLEQPHNALAREINPLSVYERMFRAAGPQGNAVKQDTLLLDRVLGHAKQMRARVGTADQARLDEYLSIVRSLEARMTRASDPKRNTWKPRTSLTACRSRRTIRRAMRNTFVSCST